MWDTLGGSGLQAGILARDIVALDHVAVVNGVGVLGKFYQSLSRFFFPASIVLVLINCALGCLLWFTPDVQYSIASGEIRPELGKAYQATLGCGQRRALLPADRFGRIAHLLEPPDVRGWPSSRASAFVACRNQGKRPRTLFSLGWLGHFFIVGRNRPAHQWPDLFDQVIDRTKSAIAALAGRHGGACGHRLSDPVPSRYHFSSAGRAASCCSRDLAP